MQGYVINVRGDGSAGVRQWQKGLSCSDRVREAIEMSLSLRAASGSGPDPSG